MTPPPRAVFDCNTLLQAMSSPRGAAGECVEQALGGHVQLFASIAILDELRDVASRPRVAAKLRLTSSRIDAFITALQAAATVVDQIDERFAYPRDPDDAHYINLAIASQAYLIVSHDKDLLDLMNDQNPDGRLIRADNPAFHVLTPRGFLAAIRI